MLMHFMFTLIGCGLHPLCFLHGGEHLIGHNLYLKDYFQRCCREMNIDDIKRLSSLLYKVYGI